MRKIEERKKGELIARLFENQLAHEKCYTFKIYKGKPNKDNVVGMSYIYYLKQEKCREDMLESLNQIAMVVNEFK